MCGVTFILLTKIMANNFGGFVLILLFALLKEETRRFA